MSWAMLTIRGLINEESASKLIQIVSGIQFLAACRAEILIFLLAMSQVLLSVARVYPSFSAVGLPPSSKPEMEFFFIDSVTQPPPLGRALTPFKVSTDQFRSTEEISLFKII